MPAAPIPENDDKRLDALLSYEVLDTSADQMFQDIVVLAARICGQPMATISLVDKDRQFFLARTGLALCETPREQALCGYAILSEDVLEISDTTQDERVRDSDLVTGPPFLRFYAGAPLINSDGFALGTLCVMGDKPGKLDDDQRSALLMLGRIVMEQLEARRKLAGLSQTGLELKHSRDELRRSREELSRAYDAVSQAEEARQKFLSNMTHELRTPLNAIVGAAQLVSTAPGFDPAYRSHMKMIDDGAKKLLDMVTRLMDLTRDHSRPEDAELDVINLSAFLEETIRPYRRRAEEKRLHFELSLLPRLPTKIIGDSNKVLGVLQQLLENAVKFTDSGGVVVRVRPVGEAGNQFIDIVVQDSGPGIPAAQRTELFEPFYQSVVGCEGRGGAGIGLALAKTYAEKLGATLSLQPDYDSGCAFNFRFPYEQVVASSEFEDALQASTRVPSDDVSPAPEALTARVAYLDAGLRERICSYAIACNAAAIENVSDDVKEVDAELAAHIQKMARAYEFSAMAELFAEKEGL